ncbi:hypothetical protein EV210_114133 [Anaerospora hongkongensis]|uniref:Uncharacterized protein n=1 Tax=Anaerospora hongkongensis TaxID=244830 RepID=A0A4R1PV29_9FIRM|nr:hypothetical protein [Anaerospora hongkongensis]TCL35113.1 hypothetical protein EV210_114133 [Anaerospora hongkongensis]
MNAGGFFCFVYYIIWRQIKQLTMSSHENRVAAHRKPVLFAIIQLSVESTGHGGQTRAAASRANGPAGSKGAANCATPPPVFSWYHTGQGNACSKYLEWQD